MTPKSDRDLIAEHLANRGATKCPPAALNATQADLSRDLGKRDPFTGQEVTPASMKARQRRSGRKIGVSNMKTNKIGAKV